MADEDKQSKTEQPTAKRRSESEKKSGPPRSRELTSALTLLTSFLCLYWTGGSMFGKMKEISAELLGEAGTYTLTRTSVYSLMLKIIESLAFILGPYFLVVSTVVMSVTILQGGWSFSPERLALSLDRLDPVNGIKKLFNKDALAELVKSILKLAIVGYVAYRTLRQETESLIFLGARDVPDILETFGQIAFKLVLHTGGILLVLGILDYFFVRWRFTQNLKMSKHEVKEESKESEGDPQVKRKMRSIQLMRARKRYSKIIPTADVVITNPTHYAVALKYDRDRMCAPVVIAKGADYLAQKIKEIAREHNVMLVENRFLARELYAQVEEGAEIPEALYAAVAEVLAYVYGLKGKI
jgi:flagellar biosynthetic protein FlhB